MHILVYSTPLWREANHMTRELIDTFLAVYECRNLTAAARRLFSTQSTVSHRLALLEDEVGAPLFSRGRGQRSAEPTAAGERFVELAHQWLALYDATESVASASTRTEVVVGGADLINNFTFAPLYHSIIERYDQMRLRVRTHHSGELYDMVENRGADVGFAFERLNYPDVVATPLYREEMYVISSAKSGHGESVHAADLPAETEIYLQWSTNYATWHNRLWPQGRHLIHASTGTQALGFLDVPGRWAVVPWSLYESLGEPGDLVISRLEERPPERTCYRLMRRGGTMPTHAEAVAALNAEVDLYVQTLIETTAAISAP